MLAIIKDELNSTFNRLHPIRERSGGIQTDIRIRFQRLHIRAGCYHIRQEGFSGSLNRKMTDGRQRPRCATMLFLARAKTSNHPRRCLFAEGVLQLEARDLVGKRNEAVLVKDIVEAPVDVFDGHASEVGEIRNCLKGVHHVR
jgi:hypothetical protein